MLIDKEDAAYLRDLKEKHDCLHRDLYPIFDFEWGCRTVNGLIYITEGGDVLPCPFIHVSLGNIIDEPLSTILERGWRVTKFRDYSSHCLAGEDREFIENYMSKAIGRTGPVPFNEAFTDDDLYEDGDLEPRTNYAHHGGHRVHGEPTHKNPSVLSVSSVVKTHHG